MYVLFIIVCECGFQPALLLRHYHQSKSAALILFTRRMPRCWFLSLGPRRLDAEIPKAGFLERRRPHGSIQQLVTVALAVDYCGQV